MAEVEEPRYTTLAERIAALNQQKNFEAPPPTKFKKPPPPPPPGKPARQSAAAAHRPPSPVPSSGAQLNRSPTVPVLPTRPPANSRNGAAPPPLPRRSTVAEEAGVESPALPGRKLAPPLPTRRSNLQTSPVLPPPKPSPSTRRPSAESDRSFVSTMSTFSLNNASSVTSSGSTDPLAFRKLPPTLDKASLPKLPPTRRELEAQAAEAARVLPVLPTSTKSPPVVPQIGQVANRPSLPPRLPSRPARPGSEQPAEEQAPALPNRRLPPPPSNGFRSKSTLEQGFGGLKRPQHSDDMPPPVPLASRPTFDQIDLANRAPPALPEPDCCLVCRDFSGPDTVAAQHPTSHLPRHTIAPYLAHVLCDPFPSKTDKARAIFTWCHHNIAYDVDAFFGGCIPQGQTTDEMILSGKGVCEGYARVYEAIALAAGLECYLVCGHGKGFGYAPLRPGEQPRPKDATGHAWNAVRIDGGEWKLLDACWGAGNVCDRRAERYEKRFDPSFFSMENDEFGRRHYPEDDRHFYRSDGRVLPWAEYITEPDTEEPMTLCSDAEQEGIDKKTVSPKAKRIPVHSGEIVRFQFGKHCPHWTFEKHGGGKIPYLLFIKIHGLDGRKEDYVPLTHEGFWWYCDIPARDLGAPGQQLMCYAVENIQGRSARGVTAQEFMSKKGRCAMRFMGIGMWELV